MLSRSSWVISRCTPRAPGCSRGGSWGCSPGAPGCSPAAAGCFPWARNPAQEESRRQGRGSGAPRCSLAWSPEPSPQSVLQREYYSVLYNTTLNCRVLVCTTQYYFALQSTSLYYTILFCTTQCRVVLCSAECRVVVCSAD